MNDITPSKFSGVSGLFKQWANFGVIGVLSGLAVYVVTITLPDVQKQFHESLKAEREAAREEIKEERVASRAEAAKSREHGERATKEIGDAVRGLSEVIIEVQGVTHKNQMRMIELSEKRLGIEKGNTEEK